MRKVNVYYGDVYAGQLVELSSPQFNKIIIFILIKKIIY